MLATSLLVKVVPFFISWTAVAGAAAQGKKAAALSEAAATAAAPWALRFHRERTNAFGEPGEWLLEPAAAAGGAGGAGGLRLLPSAQVLRRPLRQPLACAPDDDEAYAQGARQYITNAYRGAAFAPRTLAATCGAGARCGRAVVDGAFEEEDLALLEKLGVQQWGGLHELRELVEETFSLPSGRLTPIGGQVDDNVQADIPCQMHVDFQSRPGDYYYAAILYLSDQGPVEEGKTKGKRKTRRGQLRCESCETVFVDEVSNGTGLAAQGLAVQPRRGRVALFSGGAENLHCKLPSSGSRRVAQVFFRCGRKDEM